MSPRIILMLQRHTHTYMHTHTAAVSDLHILLSACFDVNSSSVIYMKPSFPLDLDSHWFFDFYIFFGCHVFVPLYALDETKGDATLVLTVTLSFDLQDFIVNPRF